jgi:hypothetical protein
MSQALRYFPLFLLITLLPLLAAAQTNDAQLWTSFNLEKKLNKKLSAALSEEFRFTENITELGTYFTDLSLSWKISKNWRFGGGHRFTCKRNLDDSYSKRNRFYIDLAYRNKIDKLSITIRGRLQSVYVDYNSSPTGHDPLYYNREKLTLKYDLEKRYTPYVNAEMFLPLQSEDPLYINAMRYCAGIEYAFDKRNSLDVYYMIQREYNVKNPETDFVTGIGYYYSF